MGERTRITWTRGGHTYNPWQGCHKVSPGCRDCYMYSEKIRYGQEPNVVVRSKPPTFNAPLKWTEPAFVFTCSWSDWFIAEADAWRDEAWDIIRRTPHLTYQILTKRPERIAAHLPADWGRGWPNVWLGVSAENQATADERIPVLLTVPAALRFVSAEPLLEPLDLTPYFRKLATGGPGWKLTAGLALEIADRVPEWIIVGGESGTRARPFDIGWARDLIRQCSEVRVPVFVKQLGAFPTAVLRHDALGACWRTERDGSLRMILQDRKGADPAEWPEDLRVQEWPDPPRHAGSDGAAEASHG